MNNQSDIKVGDLVMVIRPWRCCGYTKGLGLIFKVERIGIERWFCGNCGAPSNELRVFSGNIVPPIYRLRRIDPLSREDTIETTKEEPNERIKV